MEDLTGTILMETYRIDGPLGQGGMGSVYRGEHVRTGRKVAIKLLHESFLDNPNVVQRFGREARAASAIKHPGIVEVLDLDQTKDDIPFLVMELLPGYSLASRIEAKERLSLKETMEVMAQLLEALDAAHEHGVVHRDLKPDNVILVPRKRRSQLVKILDFGISQKSDERISNLTVAGSVLGTPHYMAPEQALGDSAVDRRADIYAAGIVMYECLTGEVPFDADNYNRLIHVILNETPAPPRDRGAEIGPELELALLQCIAKRKESRPATAAAMLTLLEEARARDEARGNRNSAAPTQIGVADAKPVSGKHLKVEPAKRDDDVSASVPGLAAVGAAGVPSAATSASFAQGELVIAPAVARSRRPKPKPSAAPKVAEVDDDFDPFMDGDEDAADLQLDEAALSMPPTSLRPSMGARASISGQHQAITSRRPQVSVSKRPAKNPSSKPALLYALVALVLIGGGIVGARLLFSGGDETDGPQVPEPLPTPTADPAVGATSMAVTTGRVSVELSDLPPGASVTLDGLPAGRFPLSLRRGSTHVLEVSAPGYETREIRFTADTDKRLRGNLRPGTGGVR